ncbi:MAG: serine hydrolase [Rubrivivax sp.]|nr:serine hydrolase [Rubrivivax sp.]
MPPLPASHPLDARASDPALLGWMVGSPPPPEKRIRFDDGTCRQFPQIRWAYSHQRQLVPTRAVPRGTGPVWELPRAPREDLDAVRFMPIGADAPMSWGEAFDANYTDGIVVLHRGRIVQERYAGVLRPEVQHLAMSVTKSFVGLLGAMLVADGTLDEQAPASNWVPELSGSAFGHATVRQLLDMTTALRYSEDYANPAAEIYDFVRAGHVVPRPADYTGPDGFHAFLRMVQAQGTHGEAFAYKTVNTDVLAWVMARATGQALDMLLAERLWQPLGTEHDAYFSVDALGTPFAGGGLNLALRDLARVGELMRLRGTRPDTGHSIVPGAVIDDIARGADPARFAKAGYGLLLGWSYRSMWWVTHNPHGAYTARGVHGQGIYVDPAAEMVVARFASHPMAANAHLDPTSLPAYHALARHLMAEPG